MDAALTPRPIHDVEYELLVRAGTFDGEAVELLDGQLYAAEEGLGYIESPPHAEICARMGRILVEGIAAELGSIRVGSPFALSDLSRPKPDFVVVRPQDANRTAHPSTASLVVEVARTSRATDLGLKASLYAGGGISDYWVVDLIRSVIVVHRDPVGMSYATITRHPDGVVRPLHHPEVAVDVRALLR